MLPPELHPMIWQNSLPTPLKSKDFFPSLSRGRFSGRLSFSVTSSPPGDSPPEPGHPALSPSAQINRASYNVTGVSRRPHPGLLLLHSRMHIPASSPLFPAPGQASARPGPDFVQVLSQFHLIRQVFLDRLFQNISSGGQGLCSP